MHIRIVTVTIDEHAIEAFMKATQKIIQGTLTEKGVIRYDVLQEKENPSRVTFFEVFETDEDRLYHFNTPHFKAWNEKTEGMITGQIESVQYNPIFPAEELKWKVPYKV